MHGLATAHQRADDGTGGGFLLVEIDADGRVIDDWVEVGFEEAKEHGATRANAEAEGLAWEPVPDTEDLAKYIRGRPARLINALVRRDGRELRECARMAYVQDRSR